MINRLGMFSLVLLLVLLFGTECLAHKITVFGYVDQAMVKTESKFSGGRPAKGCQLTVLTGTSPVIVGRTDEKGRLDFPVPEQPIGFDILVSCGEGHQGKWRIDTEELGRPPATPISTGSPQKKVTLPVQDSALQLMIRAELAAELGPIKHQLAELKQDSVSLADIMGGLGYFLGLAGLASYMRFRRDGK